MHDVFVFIAGMFMPTIIGIVLTYAEWLKTKIKEM